MHTYQVSTPSNNIATGSKLCFAGIMTISTTLLEPSGNIYLCEGDHVTLQCNVSSGSISWMWHIYSTEVYVIYTMLDGKTTRTDGSI